MRELLVVIDYQNDFVTGALGNPAAAALEPGIAARVAAQLERGGQHTAYPPDEAIRAVFPQQLVQQGGTAAAGDRPQQGQWQYLRRETDKLSHGAKEAGEDIQGAAVAEHGDHRKQADQGRGDGGGGFEPLFGSLQKAIEHIHAGAEAPAEQAGDEQRDEPGAE